MILDDIIKLFDPLTDMTYKYWENKYIMYGLGVVFLLFMGLIGYIIFTTFFK